MDHIKRSLGTGGKQARMKEMTVNSGKMNRKGPNHHECKTAVTLYSTRGNFVVVVVLHYAKVPHPKLQYTAQRLRKNDS